MLITLAHLRDIFTVHKLNIIHGDLTGVCTAEADFPPKVFDDAEAQTGQCFNQ